MKNKILAGCLLLFIVFSFSACVSYSEFARRKYLKGNFYCKAERVPVVYLKQYTEEISKADTLNNTLADPAISYAEKTVKDSPGVLHPPKDMLVPNSNIINSTPQENKRIILNERKTGIARYKISEPGTEQNSRHALSFGILGLVFTVLIVTSFYLGTSFSVIALTKARKVLKDTNATKEQIRRAKTGKVLGIISLTLCIIIAVLSIIILTAFAGSGVGE